MTQGKAFMTVKEFAEETKSHENTIHRWIKSGVIRSVKIGKKRLIPTAELHKLVKGEVKRITIGSIHHAKPTGKANGTQVGEDAKEAMNMIDILTQNGTGLIMMDSEKNVNGKND